MTHSTDPPPASTGPYKSRLFNLLNRQRIVWGDRLAQAGRSLQVAAVWGGQMLLYPLYLLTQFGRGLSLRLESAVSGQAALPKTKAELPPCDRPIKNTLEQLQELVEEITVAATSTLALNPAPTTIQSIASDRQTHHLILIDVTNQPQAKLSPDQQQHLRQRMLWEMADYSHQHYLFKVKANQYRIPQQLTSDEAVWTPVQRFWRFMRWLQGSPIAVAANVFGEAEFALPTPTLVVALPASSIPLPDWDTVACPDHPFVIQVDEAIADLEECQTQLNHDLGQWWQTQTLTPTSPLARARQTLQQGLDFLLGTNDLMTVTSDPPGVESSAWLAWEYLSNPSQEDYNTAVPPEQTFVEAEMALDLAQTQPEAPDEPTASLQVAPVAKVARSQPEPEQPNPTLTHPVEASESPDHQPDWIEVPSQALGYETHFLERVLNGFDTFLALCEELGITLWRWGKLLFKQLLARLTHD